MRVAIVAIQRMVVMTNEVIGVEYLEQSLEHVSAQYMFSRGYGSSSV